MAYVLVEYMICEKGERKPNFYYGGPNKKYSDLINLTVKKCAYKYENKDLAEEVRKNLNKGGYNFEIEEFVDDKEKMFSFKVILCDGKYCKGNISFFAENESIAEDMALKFVGEKLFEAFPTLDIEYSVVLADETDCKIY